jgi:hypothetical protein
MSSVTGTQPNPPIYGSHLNKNNDLKDTKDTHSNISNDCNKSIPATATGPSV